MKAPGRMLFLAGVALAAAACGDASPASSFPFSREAKAPEAFDDIFQVVDTLILQGTIDERDDPLFARFDGRHFTISAPEARWVGVYRADGSLVEEREGLLQPISARRARDGRLLVTDMLGSLVFFPEEPAREDEAATETTSIPWLALDAIDLGNRRYLITGVSRWRRQVGGSKPPHLHVWNAESGTVERSFFAPSGDRADIDDRGEWASAAVRGDTIWAVSQFSDSIFVFAMDGSRIGAVALPLAAHPVLEAATDASAYLWSIDSIHLLAGGGTIVQLGDKTAMNDPNETRYLVITGADGATQTVLAGTHLLHVVSDGLFYFQDPESPNRNSWLVVRLRAIQ